MTPRRVAMTAIPLLICAVSMWTAHAAVRERPSTSESAASVAELEHKIRALELEQQRTIKSLNDRNQDYRYFMVFVGILITALVGIQAYAIRTSVKREVQRDQDDRPSSDRITNIMAVVQRTLETRLDSEQKARREAQEARSESQNFRERFKVVEGFLEGYQKTIKRTRQEIEDTALRLAREVSRHDFKYKTSDLNALTRQFDSFKAEHETVEANPVPFSVRVSYLRGIAAHYANQPEVSKRYLTDVVHDRQPKPDETERAYHRRVANAYYYLGLTEANFGNDQDAIAAFEEANKLDLEKQDFLTRVVTAEAYVMSNEFESAREYLSTIEKGLGGLEQREGRLHSFHQRLRSRAALVRANMAILERKAAWRKEVQRFLKPVYSRDPEYYYATATLAQVSDGQDGPGAAQQLFREAYETIDHSGDLGKVTEARSKILLMMVIGICAQHGAKDEKRAGAFLDVAEESLNSLPRMGEHRCTVFSTLSKRNETAETIRAQIRLIRKGTSLLERGSAGA